MHWPILKVEDLRNGPITACIRDVDTDEDRPQPYILAFEGFRLPLSSSQAQALSKSWGEDMPCTWNWFGREVVMSLGTVTLRSGKNRDVIVVRAVDEKVAS